LRFVIRPVIVSEHSDILFVLFKSLQPVYHIVDTDFNTVANILVVGLFEKQVFLRIVASDAERYVRRYDNVAPVSAN
jgi:hypothetical protein